MVPEPPGCPPGYFGYPCFRPDALPIILIIGDEPFRECYLPDGVDQGDCVSAKPAFMDTPDFPIVSNAVNAFGAKVVGIMGNASASNEAVLRAVTAGMPVCWKIIVKENQTVEPLETVQLFKAFVHLWGNDTTLLDTRTVYFVVPPDVSSIDPE